MIGKLLAIIGLVMAWLSMILLGAVEGVGPVAPISFSGIVVGIAFMVIGFVIDMLSNRGFFGDGDGGSRVPLSTPPHSPRTPRTGMGSTVEMSGL